MSTHFQLIPWTILTHYYDTLRHQKLQRTPMTYLDLLTELQNLSEEDLLKPVTIYDEETDLQSKVDLFLNPIYYFGTDPDSAAAFPTTMYFNGNDAITLELLGTGIVVDLIGKVGEDPGASWNDSDGNYWTKDHTLIRKSTVLVGDNNGLDLFNPSLNPFGLCMSFTLTSGDALTLSGNGKSNPVVL